MSNLHQLKIASVTALLAVWTGSTQAGLLGSSINVSAYYPDSSTLYKAGPNAQVSEASAFAEFLGRSGSGVRDINHRYHHRSRAFFAHSTRT